jgi:hypothetical protein
MGFRASGAPSFTIRYPPAGLGPPDLQETFDETATRMTSLQNDPQQHPCEAKHRKCRVPRGGKRSLDSEYARRELSKSGLGSNFGPQS